MQPTESLSEASFAFGQYGDGGWASGTAYNRTTQSEAQSAAMNTCNQNGYNCSLRRSFRNTRFALAVHDNGNAWGFSTNNDMASARREALLTCVKGAATCSIREAFCDNVSEAAVRAAAQAEAQRQQAEYNEYVRNWTLCFAGSPTGGDEVNQIAYCDRALDFPRTNDADRNDLLQQRQRLTLVVDRKRERLEQQASDEQIRQDRAADETVNQQIERNRIERDERLANRRRVEDVVRTVEESELAAGGPDWIARLAAWTQKVLALSIAVLVGSMSWYVSGKQMPIPKVMVANVLSISGIGILLGVLCNIALRYGVLADFSRVVTLVGYVSALGAGALGFVVLGASIQSRRRSDQLSLRLPTLIGASVLTTLLCLAASILHAKSDEHLDDPLFISIMFSWVFVGGVTLADPEMRPLLQQLEKSLGPVGSRITRFLTASCSVLYKALQSVFRWQPDPAAHPVPAHPESRALAIPTEIPTASSSQRMQMKLKRSQRSGLTGKMIFILDARMEVPAEEYGLIQTYKLGNMVIYDSSKRQRHAEAMKAHLESTKEQDASFRDSAGKQLWGIGKTLYRFARVGVSATMAGLSLRITVYSLMQGVHVECKSMGELLGAEVAIIEAGENLRAYLDNAATFDGREKFLEF